MFFRVRCPLSDILSLGAWEGGNIVLYDVVVYSESFLLVFLGLHEEKVGGISLNSWRDLQGGLRDAKDGNGSRD